MIDRKIPPLRLRAGDLVEVLSEQEILTTLDEQGTLDGMPFMPEMLEYCGQRFRVDKRADKTCDTIAIAESRRVYDAVHLQGLRCNGSAHGGCQALCFLFWKEAWLKRVERGRENLHWPATAGSPAHTALRCDRLHLHELTGLPESSNGSEIAYRCQATDLLKASQPMAWWDIRQYVRDVWSGNVGFLALAKVALFRIFQKTLRIGAYRAQIEAFNRFQSWRGGTPYPLLEGELDETPREELNLQPGELVQVKSYKEILQTLNKKNKNLGLRFDAEMVPYCGSVRRVRARVERIIDERTGQMISFSRDCIILDGAICLALYSDRRLFCPRSIYPYWREIWLRRVEDAPEAQGKLSTSAEVTQKQG
jgi:hypothetical protein